MDGLRRKWRQLRNTANIWTTLSAAFAGCLRLRAVVNEDTTEFGRPSPLPYEIAAGATVGRGQHYLPPSEMPAATMFLLI